MESIWEFNPFRSWFVVLTTYSLGMVELGPAGVVGGDDEDEECPPGR